MRLRWLLVGLALLSASPAAPSAGGPGPIALLRVRASFLLSTHGAVFTEQDLFADTNRALLLHTFTAGNPIVVGWLDVTRKGKAGPASFAELQRQLAENRVGEQTGECSVRPGTTPTVSGSYDVTWFSPNSPRKNQFTVDIGGSSPPCPPEIPRLLNAINLYARSAGLGFGWSVE